jgi:hypothetical protein
LYFIRFSGVVGGRRRLFLGGGLNSNRAGNLGIFVGDRLTGNLHRTSCLDGVLGEITC